MGKSITVRVIRIDVVIGVFQNCSDQQRNEIIGDQNCEKWSGWHVSLGWSKGNYGGKHWSARSLVGLITFDFGRFANFKLRNKKFFPQYKRSYSVIGQIWHQIHEYRLFRNDPKRGHKNDLIRKNGPHQCALMDGSSIFWHTTTYLLTMLGPHQ